LCSGVPLMVHPSRTFEHAATPPKDTRIMTVDHLPQLRDAFLAFCVAVAQLPSFGTTKDIASLLVAYRLVPDSFIQTYTTNPVVR
jgi:hypothetical protein